MLGDCKAMYALVTQEGATPRTRYYERATMLIKRAVLMLLLAPFLINTQFMIADMFTKALDKAAFIRFRNVMMNEHGSLRDTLKVAMGSFGCGASRLADRLLQQL